MKLFKLLLSLIVAFLGVSFACLNADLVKVNLYIGHYQMHLSVLLVITLGIGILIGFLTMMGVYWRLRAEHYRTKSKARMTEKELSNLRTLPIKDIE